MSLSEIPVARALWWLRRLGRGDSGVRRPFLDSALPGAVQLDDVPGEGIVIGLTGQFWRFRGGRDPGRPRTASEFLAYDRPDMCKAVLDFRIEELGPGAVGYPPRRVCTSPIRPRDGRFAATGSSSGRSAA